MIGAEHEGPRPATGQGFSDAVSFAFADPAARLYGLARLGLAPQDGGASALAVLFCDQERVGAHAQGAAADADADWTDLAVDQMHVSTHTPLSHWRVEWDGEASGFALDFHALTGPLELGPDTAAARVSGVEGYEQLCRVEGEVRADGARRTVHCLGQRGHGWGAASWDRMALARTVSAWVEDGPRAVALSAVRPVDATGHADEAVTAFLVEPGPEGPAAVAVADPRLSTTYDSEGRQRRAGLELWLSPEDELPRRAAGEVSCGTSLDLGRLRLDCAFFSWHVDGRAGAGRYDVLRRR